MKRIWNDQKKIHSRLCGVALTMMHSIRFLFSTYWIKMCGLQTTIIPPQRHAENVHFGRQTVDLYKCLIWPYRMLFILPKKIYNYYLIKKERQNDDPLPNTPIEFIYWHSSIYVAFALSMLYIAQSRHFCWISFAFFPSSSFIICQCSPICTKNRDACNNFDYNCYLFGRAVK